MASNLLYWTKKYLQLKKSAVCVDVETMGWNKPISVIGISRPGEGEPNYRAFVHGRNLTWENLREAFDGIKAVITFNGIRFDVPRIREEFACIIPTHVVNIDLFRFAQTLYGCSVSLKTVEVMLNVSRLDERLKKKGMATLLWRQYQRGDPQGLAQLLSYNRQDTVNLYPLAEELVAQVRQRARDGSLPDPRDATFRKPKRGLKVWRRGISGLYEPA